MNFTNFQLIFLNYYWFDDNIGIKKRGGVLMLVKVLLMQKEAKARIKINLLLQEAKWRFFDDKNKKANIALESNVKMTQKDIDAFGEDYEKTRALGILTGD